MVVRLALLGALIGMGEDAESELGVLIDDLPLGRAGAEVLGDESLVLERLLDEGAPPCPAGWTGIALEDAVALVRKLLERVAHRPSPAELQGLAAPDWTSRDREADPVFTAARIP